MIFQPPKLMLMTSSTVLSNLPVRCRPKLVPLSSRPASICNPFCFVELAILETEGEYTITLLALDCAFRETPRTVMARFDFIIVECSANLGPDLLFVQDVRSAGSVVTTGGGGVLSGALCLSSGTILHAKPMIAPIALRTARFFGSRSQFQIVRIEPLARV